jgi:AraC-like DNA-binding protein
MGSHEHRDETASGASAPSAPSALSGPSELFALAWKTSPRWYLWEGGFLLLAAAEGVVPPHAHHAIQIVIAADGEIAAKEDGGDWRAGRGVIVRQDTRHAFDGKGATGAMLFVDPESSEGTWLGTGLRENVTVISEARISACATALETFGARPLASPEIGELIRQCVLSLCPGAPPVRRPDERIAKVVASIRASDDLRLTLEAAAAQAFLSPSRFAHLFKEQVGLPFRRYMLWRKLARAMVAMGRERTIAAAAHAADFADAAHLTRTFYQMFGLTPSALMRGDFLEIASPFR